MPIEEGLPRFVEWFPAALLVWLIAVGSLVVTGLVLGFLVAAVKHGPLVAVGKTSRVLAEGVADVVGISLRRVWALAWLAVKESIRRRVVVVFAVFILLLLFAGWFMDPGNPNPARLYLNFVLTVTGRLVLLLALFLSAFSLPMDIRTRTLHTVVTKPVRSSEIVLGRMLGFTMVGTGLLVVMAVVSLLFMQGLSHRHTVDESIVSQSGARTGTTSKNYGHRHKVYIDGSGRARVEPERGHWHELSIVDAGAEAQTSLARGMLVARVPIYGELSFRDRDGVDAKEGISVGEEWTYRGYIPGGTAAALIWTFDDIRKERFPEKKFPDGLPVEMTLSVYRSYKADIEKGVLGSIALRNPDTGLWVEVEVFESKEFATNRLTIPREITRFSGTPLIIPRRIETPDGVQFDLAKIDYSLAEKRQFDLFEDLVAADGRVEIWVRCLDPAQYFGAATPDLYLRAADAPFALNFFKGYFGIWLQMVLVIGFGVMFSTFLSAPVAMIATLGTLVGGFFIQFMTQLARHEAYGGGPVEALIRLVKQENLLTELGTGLWARVVEMIDRVMEGGLWLISWLLPAFDDFNYADYVAYGFNISSELILIRTLNALAFLLPVFVAGYFFLKIREVAR